MNDKRILVVEMEALRLRAVPGREPFRHSISSLMNATNWQRSRPTTTKMARASQVRSSFTRAPTPSRAVSQIGHDMMMVARKVYPGNFLMMQSYRIQD
jgi:hypothetical protein